MVTFEFRNVTFVVTYKDGSLVYRDRAHLGGPWSKVSDTLTNPSYDRVFRTRLKKAANDVESNRYA